MFDWSPCISGKGKENHYTGGTLDKAPYNSLYVYWSFKHAISSRTGFKHKHQQTSVDQFKTWITFKDGSCYKKFLAVKFKDWVSRPTLRKTQYQGRTQNLVQRGALLKEKWGFAPHRTSFALPQEHKL